MAASALPESFADDALCAILHSDVDELISSALQGQEVGIQWWSALPLVCGVLVRARSGLFRVYRRSECRVHKDESLMPSQLFHIVRFVVHDKDALLEWTADDLWRAAEELTTKSLNLNNLLCKELFMHPLYPFHPHSRRLIFRGSFLRRVEEYHQSIQRPEGTFSCDLTEEQLTLASTERTLCPQCNGRRQLYCGPCGGLRLPKAEPLLPARVPLPFDVLLLLHWNESLRKCTGIHAAALGEEGATTYCLWEKEEEKCQSIVASLDPARDVLLFPFEDSTAAEDFPWTTGRHRVVVLEASWAYGKSMAQHIVQYRRRAGLPALPSVSLRNIVGQYWRFQSLGSSAVSTIEAIAYAAKAAGCTQKQFEDLLFLFMIQKLRVLRNTKDGTKVPRAVDVVGTGTGSWREVEVLEDELRETEGSG